MPSLCVRENDTQREIPISPLPFSLGRSPENHLVLPDPKVSRTHCRIIRREGGYWLVDMGSSNGTLVNGVRVTEKLLVSDDQIALGSIVLFFKDDAAPAPVIPPEVLKPLAELAPAHADPVPRIDGAVSSSLPLLYQIARSIVCGAGMKDVLDMTLALILQTVQAERGAILTLRGRDLVPIAIRSRGQGTDPEGGIPVSATISRRAIEEKAAIITSDARYDPRFSAGDSITAFGIRSALCVPLWEEEKITGAIYLDSRLSTHVFTEEDMNLLSTVSHILAMGLRQEQLKEEVRLEAILRANLERFLSPDVADVILKKSMEQDIIPLEIQERVATILFADIKDFTPLSEKLSPAEVAGLLNGFFTRMGAVVFRHEGSVNKFIGDAVMAIFGAPLGHENDAELAVRAAIDMMAESNAYNLNLGEHKRFTIRIGINTGKVVAGNIGSLNRMEYTVVGDAVNIAARLQSAAGPGQILIGEETYRWINHLFSVRPLGKIRLKGKSRAVTAYEVLGAKDGETP